MKSWLLHVKYICWYIFHMIKIKQYTFIDIHKLKTTADFLFYLYIFLFFPITTLIFLTWPLFYTFKLSKIWAIFSIWIVVFGLEFIWYTFMASENNLYNGLFNFLISVLVFCIFFG